MSPLFQWKQRNGGASGTNGSRSGLGGRERGETADDAAASVALEQEAASRERPTRVQTLRIEKESEPRT